MITIDSLLRDEGVCGECYGCEHLCVDREVNWRGCECPRDEECPRVMEARRIEEMFEEEC